MPDFRPMDDVAIDRWLHTHLRARHDAVLHERIPESLLRLLREDAR